jgi:L-aspartate semialdehyde sulfurtransferase ferredoxin
MTEQSKRKIILHFPTQTMHKPIAYHLVKDFNLVINILQANVTEEKDRFLILEVTGRSIDIEKSFQFLKSQDIRVEDLEKGIDLNLNKCIHCGLCVGLCPTDALLINRETWEVVFDKGECVVCDLCLKYCPVDAIEMEFLS